MIMRVKVIGGPARIRSEETAGRRRRRPIENLTVRLRVSRAQLGLAFPLARDVVPVPGTRRIGHLGQDWDAGDRRFDNATMEDAGAAFPLRGFIGERPCSERLEPTSADSVAA
ncbi:hypothetical protein [Sphingomonas sp. DT-51]|uniref:hypothetical protein n=1 Tax=Sphingomonas sp. DT-51 TaxID=3396165 RepID=UPI003F53FF0A